MGVIEIGDFRSISCCNTFYKVVFKILANMFKWVLFDVVLEDNSTFIEGRLLGEYFLFAIEFLMVSNSQWGL